ncbi:MAG: amidohydrolase family protein [Asgard group archaeon]|nr:amidohydrolase family protein [Asgard group archaeon]
MMNLFGHFRKLLNRKFVAKLILIMTFTILLLPLTNNPVKLESAAPRPIVDYIFINGNIITVNQTNSIAEAIAIANGKILAVGDSEEILGNFETEGETTYDLEGRTIMPGIIDGHTHLIGSIFWGGYETLAGGQQLAMAFGYTTLNEKSIDEGQVETLQEAETNGTLRMRLNLFPIHNLASLDHNNETVILERFWPTNNPILDHHKKVRVPGIKIYADGAGGGPRGLPAMTIPYTEQMLNDWNGMDPYGELYINQTALNATVDAIHDKGFSVAFHTMGDRGIDTVLTAIEYALNGSTNDAFRHQIEHSSFLRPDQITRAKNIRTIHSIRGYFPTYWQEDYEAGFHVEWLDWNLNRYSLPGEGVHSYLETDFTFANYDFDDKWSSRTIRPFVHMWGLVTKKALNSSGHLHLPDPWIAEHLLTREQALKLMTIDGAYAVKQEDYLGSLEVDKYADLIVLTDDPLTCPEDGIKDIEVMLTMINGSIEYLWSSHDFPKIYTRTDTTGPLGLDSITFLIGSIPILTSILLFGRRKKRKL